MGGLTPLARVDPTTVVHVTGVVRREVVCVRMSGDDGKDGQAAEFEIEDASARCRVIAAGKPIIAALRRRLAQQVIFFNVSARPLPAGQRTTALRLVLDPTAHIMPTPCEPEDLKALV